MPSGSIAIINYGMGNLHSVWKKLKRLRAEPVITSDPAEIRKAEKIILPGVGHFGKAMQNLNDLKLIDVLNEEIITKKKPILGICLGMQLFANTSEEGNAKGLGWINAQVVRFQIKDTLAHKIPHTGWNRIFIAKESRLMKNIPDHSEFYFVHSFHYKANEQKDILNETEYEYRFVSAVEKENIFGVQYHPEKSHDAGEQLFKNFLDI